MTAEQRIVALLNLPRSSEARREVVQILQPLSVQLRESAQVPSGPGVVAMILGPESVLTPAHVAALPDLRIVATTSTGYDHVPVATVTDHGAWVTNVPDYCTDEVADHGLAFILGLLRGVVRADRLVRRGHWNIEPFRPRRIAGSRLGLVGFGRIARALAARASALGMEVSVYAPRSPASDLLRAGVHRFDRLPDLLGQVDVVSLHVPLTDLTRDLIDRDALARMRPDAFLVNVSRGGLIDQAALSEALATGRIAGAALDVLATEPPDPLDPLLTLDDAVLTPHSAWESVESLQALYSRAARSVAAVLHGQEPADAIGRPNPSRERKSS